MNHPKFKHTTNMLFSSKKILKAYLSCRKNKRRTHNALRFEVDFEHNLVTLQRELVRHTYLPSRSLLFAVTYPKLREVFAADFRDRIVHHLLVSALEPYYERTFIFASFACRKNKGLMRAVLHTQRLVRSVSHNGTSPAYYGQFDVRSFFTSIDKEILFDIVDTMIRSKISPRNREATRWLAKTLIFHDPTSNYQIKGAHSLLREVPKHKSLFGCPKGKGLPIGNLTSQFFANVYLNELDQYVKRVLKVKYYIRYVDDIVVFSNDMKEIRQWRVQIDKFLTRKLKLRLHADKDVIKPVFAGLDFVGYIIFPDHLLTRNQIVKNLKTRLYLFNHGTLLMSNNQNQIAMALSTPPSKKELAHILAMVNSYYGHFRHAHCYNLRKNLYENHFGILKQYLHPEGAYLSFKLINDHQ